MCSHRIGIPLHRLGLGIRESERSERARPAHGRDQVRRGGAVVHPDHVLLDDRTLVELSGDVVGRRADQLDAAFEGLGITCPASTGEDYVAHLYVVRVGDRDAFRAHMTARGIATEEGELPESADLESVLDAAAGLTRMEAENAFSLSLVRESRITAD